MKKDLSKQTIALATQAQPSTGGDGNKKKKKGGHYCVEGWRLEKKGESLMKDDKEWHWCTKDHYSDVKVKNGMCARHKTDEHDWSKTTLGKNNSQRRIRSSY